METERRFEEKVHTRLGNDGKTKEGCFSCAVGEDTCRNKCPLFLVRRSGCGEPLSRIRHLTRGWAAIPYKLGLVVQTIHPVIHKYPDPPA